MLCSVVSLIVSLALKSPYGKRSIKYVLYCIVLYCITFRISGQKNSNYEPVTRQRRNKTNRFAVRNRPYWFWRNVHPSHHRATRINPRKKTRVLSSAPQRKKNPQRPQTSAFMQTSPHSTHSWQAATTPRKLTKKQRN